MEKFIKQSMLIEELKKFAEDKQWREKRTIRERWLRSVGIDIFYKAIEHFPTFDAVEVVYCKDCRWYKKPGCCPIAASRYSSDCEPIPKENDFCSYGER